MNLKKALKRPALAGGLAVLVLSLTVLSAYYFVKKPRLECEVGTASAANVDLRPLLENVMKYVQREVDKKDVKDISLYFRDLKSGAWCSINKDKRFNVASLLKVPLMMEFLKSAQEHPGLLQKRLLFTGEEDWVSRQNIKPAKTLEIGTWYSVDDLIFRMIAYSDNNATLQLLKEMPLEHLYQFLDEQKIDYEKSPKGSLMSLGSYSRFFQALYDKSFLNGPMSLKALADLSAEDFPQGMHAAVPSTVQVASKFGEHESLNRDGSVKCVQLHEVGIVLDGKRPFILGIMTKGRDITTQEKIIRDVTHEVYVELEHHG